MILIPWLFYNGKIISFHTLFKYKCPCGFQNRDFGVQIICYPAGVAGRPPSAKAEDSQGEDNPPRVALSPRAPKDLSGVVGNSCPVLSTIWPNPE